MSATDDIKDLARKSIWTAPWPSRGAIQRRPPFLPPASPPAGEGGVGDLRRRTEAAGAHSPPPPALLVGDEILDSCRYGPCCANLVHVGPPVGCRFWMDLSTLQPGPIPFHPLSVSHVLKHHTGGTAY